MITDLNECFFLQKQTNMKQQNEQPDIVSVEIDSCCFSFRFSIDRNRIENCDFQLRKIKSNLTDDFFPVFFCWWK